MPSHINTTIGTNMPILLKALINDLDAARYSDALKRCEDMRRQLTFLEGSLQWRLEELNSTGKNNG